MLNLYFNMKSYENKFHLNALIKTAKKYQLDTTVCLNNEKKLLPINTQNLLIYNKQSLRNFEYI